MSSSRNRFKPDCPTLGTREQASFADEAVERVARSLQTRVASDRTVDPNAAALRETLFCERTRLANEADARGRADTAFFARIARNLARADAPVRADLVRQVLVHYADEIRGHFDPRVYAIATRALPLALSGLLNGLSPARLRARSHDFPRLEENVAIGGEVATLRALARLGTVVLVPTHSSNLDSVLFGFAIFRMGLPPFAYGAGLNLFSNPFIGFFMNHLGAYTVDRRKTDPLYRQVLKEFASVQLEHGQHSLFFPGGTRSRSGAIETRLKKGLLGTSIRAFKNNVLRRRPRPRMFVFPATATYPLVLEAKSLVANFLEKAGKQRYLAPDDEFSVAGRWVDFFRGLLRLNLRIDLVIGPPLDPFGNGVDAAGESRDPRGRRVDPMRYLLADGEVGDDPSRDAEYTRGLERRILASYRNDNVALPTSILAFALFELVRRRSPGLDLFRLLESLSPDATVPEAAVRAEVDRLLEELRDLARQRHIRLSAEATDASAVLRRGLETFRTYHPLPVIDRIGAEFCVRDSRLLFYYRNRLEGYGLRGAAPWAVGDAEP